MNFIQLKKVKQDGNLQVGLGDVDLKWIKSNLHSTQDWYFSPPLLSSISASDKDRILQLFILMATFLNQSQMPMRPSNVEIIKVIKPGWTSRTYKRVGQGLVG